MFMASGNQNGNPPSIFFTKTFIIHDPSLLIDITTEPAIYALTTAGFGILTPMLTLTSSTTSSIKDIAITEAKKPVAEFM